MTMCTFVIGMAGGKKGWMLKERTYPYYGSDWRGINARNKGLRCRWIKNKEKAFLISILIGKRCLRGWSS